MILAQYSNVVFGYHDKPIVHDFSLQLQDRCRVGLIGINGTGKTTLLRLLTGELKPENGAIHRTKDLRIGYLKQTPDVPPDTDIRSILNAPFQHLIDMEDALRRLSLKMAEDPREELLAEYDAQQEAFERQGGYRYPSNIHKVVQGLGFFDLDFDRPIHSFSGGEQARIMLARLLLEAPDLMLLDEPTNHLDIHAVEFLEQYLDSFNGGVLFISHDRYLLDRVATTIVELAWQRCEIYSGNYSFYLREREKRRAVQHKHFKLQQQRIEKLEDYIRRNMAAQKTRQAQSRLKELQRIEKIEDVRGSNRSMKLHLTVERTSGQIVFETHDLWKGFERSILFRNVSLKLHRGDIVGILGLNGSGKSTLLKILNRELIPDNGVIEWGYHVSSAYYDQHLRDLDENQTIIDEVWAMAPRFTQQEIRDHLGRFLFSGDDVFKPVGPLSGGEKARVALAKLFLTKANLLLLDEPTNHLDLPARES
ncbi:MAG TPA: ABC-F family ATP-binding cassette domain-containing protein, partial [bacterium]|nr:ABC-F family ATP-binding cassette domain-containing protein [bacterium]